MKDIEWVHCNHCLHKTKHFILAEHNREVKKAYSKDIDLWWETQYTLFACCGCENVTLRRQLTFSEWENGEVEIEFYPPQVSRQLPKWHKDLPHEIQSLVAEIYLALHSDSRRLALMGARTVIDMFVLDKIGDVGNFKQKLQALVNSGYLGIRQRDVLNVALEAGNAAAHRGYEPSPEVLTHVIDVIESLLHFYSLEETSNLVREEIPVRTGLKKTS